MVRKYAIFAVLLLLAGLLGGCGEKSAAVYCKSVYTDTMEFGSGISPGPEFEEVVLTKGTDSAYGVSVVSVKEDSVVFRYDEDCFGARVYSAGEDGSFLREGAHGRVTLCRGEQLTLEEIHLLDASHTVYIRLK